MTFDEYQDIAYSTAIYKSAYMTDDVTGETIELAWNYPGYGLGAETGEVLDILGKAIRDNNGRLNNEDIYRLRKEIGDVLWECAAIAREAGISLQACAETNLEKLASRQQRGVLKGSGDER